MGRLVDVRPAERRALLWSFLCFFFLLGAYYVLRPLRDAMAIAGGVDQLHWVFTGTLATMMVTVPVWSALVSRLPVRRLIGFTYRFFLVNILVFYAILRVPGDHAAVARAFFVWNSVFNLLVVSIFWSLLADVFSRPQGKRLFGFISAGGSAGAIVGPLLTSLVVQSVGPHNLLLIAAALLEGAATCAGRLTVWAQVHPPDAGAAETIGPTPAPAPSLPSSPRRDSVGGDAWGAILLLVRSPYLLAIAGYVLLMTTTGTMSYMLQARLVAAEELTPAARTAMFARIDLAVSVGSALVQALLAGRVLSRFGVGPGLLLSPLLTIASAVAMAAVPRLGVLMAGQIVRRITEYALARPAREVLFTTVTREEKYKPKTFIDLVIYRSGDATSAWVFTALAHLGTNIPVLALSVTPLALAWLAICLWLTRRHERAAPRASAIVPDWR